MKSAALSAFEFFAIVLAGLATVLLSIEVPPLGSDALLEDYAYKLRVTGLICYTAAGLGFLLGFWIWYSKTGRARLNSRSIPKCMLYLSIPVLSFIVVSWFRPLPRLISAFAVFGKAALPLAVVFFALIAVILHFLTVHPSRDTPPAE